MPNFDFENEKLVDVQYESFSNAPYKYFYITYKLTDEGFTDVEIQDCKSITDIEKVDKHFAPALLDVIGEMHNGKRRGGRNYNEVLVSRPKIQGVFAYDKKYEDIPEFLRKYAQDNKLPIIIFGPVK